MSLVYLAQTDQDLTCEGRLSTMWLCKGKISPSYSHTIHSVPDFARSLSQQGRASGNQERGRCLSDFIEVGGGGDWSDRPHPRATYLILAWILPRPQQGKGTKSQEGGATRHLQGEASASPRGRDTGWCVGKWGNSPTPEPHSSVTDTQETACPGSWLLSRLQPHRVRPQGCRGWPMLPQADVQEGVLHPRKMVSAEREDGSICGISAVSPQLSSQSHKPHPSSASALWSPG